MVVVVDVDVVVVGIDVVVSIRVVVGSTAVAAQAVITTRMTASDADRMGRR
jgi:hypothetical protein